MSIAQSAICRTWQPARCVICFFLVVGGLRHRGTEVFYKGPLPTIYCEQICHHLSSHRNRCSLRVFFLLCLLVYQGELVVLFRSELCGFHQNTLDMLIALFGKRRSQHLVC